jgi:hypothetical protein
MLFGDRIVNMYNNLSIKSSLTELSLTAIRSFIVYNYGKKNIHLLRRTISNKGLLMVERSPRIRVVSHQMVLVHRPGSACYSLSLFALSILRRHINRSSRKS